MKLNCLPVDDVTGLAQQVFLFLSLKGFYSLLCPTKFGIGKTQTKELDELDDVIWLIQLGWVVEEFESWVVEEFEKVVESVDAKPAKLRLTSVYPGFRAFQMKMVLPCQ